MRGWLAHLRKGLNERPPSDSIGGQPYRDAWRNLRYLRPHLLRSRSLFVVGGVVSLLGALCAFVPPLAKRFLIDTVVLGERLDLLLAGVLALAGFEGATRLARLVERYVFTRFEHRVTRDLQEELYDRTLRFPKAFFDQRAVGRMMHRLGADVMGMRLLFSATLIRILENLLRFAGGLAFLLYLEWRLALFVAVTMPLVLWGTLYFARKERVLSHHSKERHAEVHRRLQETLSSGELIKSFASEPREVGRIMSEVESQQEVTLRQRVVAAFAAFVLQLAPDAARMIVLGAGCYLVVQDELSLGSLLAFQSYLLYVFGPVTFLATTHRTLQGSLASLERVAKLYEVVPEDEGGEEVAHLTGAVEFRDVCFGYTDDDIVLEGISCAIRAGERVAVVGPSGVGKTTFLSLLMRFYQPTAGEVLYDGRPASEYNVRSLRRRIGYASQRTQLLAGSFLENLRYGQPEASLQEVERAARAAGLHELIAGLPEGYDAPIEESASNLSEGQKQRLAIARTLIKDPDIVILDEPTASLDSLAERSIFDALPEALRKRTLFIVAHRLSTVTACDRILVLKDRRLLAQGTHDELLARSEFYRELVASQDLRGPASEAPE